MCPYGNIDNVVKSFDNNTSEDIMLFILTALERNDVDRLVEIHDRLLVTDITLTIEVLVGMSGFAEYDNGDSSHHHNMVWAFKRTKYDSNVFNRVIHSVPLFNYHIARGFTNPITGEVEFYPQIGILDNASHKTSLANYKQNIYQKHKHFYKHHTYLHCCEVNDIDECEECGDMDPDDNGWFCSHEEVECDYIVERNQNRFKKETV